MNPIEIIRELEAKGAILEIRGDMLHVTAPAGVLRPEHPDMLRRSKRLIMAALSGHRVSMTEYCDILNEAVTGADMPPYRLGEPEHGKAWAAWWDTVELQRAHRRAAR